jgi:hypothetical protein
MSWAFAVAVPSTTICCNYLFTTVPFAINPGFQVVYSVCTSGLPDFSGCMIPKPKKCTKWTQNVPNEHKMYQMNAKCT